MNRIAQATPTSTSTTTQADEALRRVTAQPTDPTPEAQRAAARHQITSTLIARMTQAASTRDLTDAEKTDLAYVQNVQRESRTVLATAGRLDLIGGA